MTLTNAFIALGSNVASPIGGPEELLDHAIRQLAERAVIRAKSRFFRTPAYPTGSGPEFVNAVVEVAFSGTADQALDTCHSVEAAMGRTRRKRWAERTIDLDLLTFGAMVLPDETTFCHWRDLPLKDQKTLVPQQPILPHPRLQDRAFVLVPLADIAPDWQHPVSGLTVRQMLADLDPADISAAQPIE